MRPSYSLLTDLYQLTMAQGYFEAGRTSEQACFTMHFRDYPFDGGYAIACGLAQLAEIVEGYRFDEGDVAYLRTLEAPGGGPLFHEGFLDHLGSFELSVDVDAVLEGTPVFPQEPIVRVTGPIMECQMLETALLNCVNFETLIATKAARVCRAADGRPVAEFGLRRAQGLGGVWASRAAVVGGCASTSDVLAGKLFGIPVSGTHAHSWVMSFPDELTAFREYARIAPNNCVLLVDTYDVEQGIANAIVVGKEMRGRPSASTRATWRGCRSWPGRAWTRRAWRTAASCCPTTWTSTPSSRSSTRVRRPPPSEWAPSWPPPSTSPPWGASTS